jgi:hypothetical protein
MGYIWDMQWDIQCATKPMIFARPDGHFLGRLMNHRTWPIDTLQRLTPQGSNTIWKLKKDLLSLRYFKHLVCSWIQFQQIHSIELFGGKLCDSVQLIHCSNRRKNEWTTNICSLVSSRSLHCVVEFPLVACYPLVIKHSCHSYGKSQFTYD